MLKQTETLLISGPSGQLELLYEAPDIVGGPIAVICHPHPQFGGTMTNKVVTTLHKAYRECGVGTVRFNYRGVGKSEGIYDYGEGELHDALAVIDYALTSMPASPLLLSGFSFGAFIAAKAATMKRCAHLTTVAPVTTKWDFTQFTVNPSPWLVVYGSEDELIAASAVEAWVAASPLSLNSEKVMGASHFFHGKLLELRKVLSAHISALCYDNSVTK